MLAGIPFAGPVTLRLADGRVVKRPAYTKQQVTDLLLRQQRTKQRGHKEPLDLARFTGSLRHIPWGVREEVWARDGGACRYCQDMDGPFELDHIVPFSRGGWPKPNNLVTACRVCNQRKGARTWKPTDLDKHLELIAEKMREP